MKRTIIDSYRVLEIVNGVFEASSDLSQHQLRTKRLRRVYEWDVQQHHPSVGLPGTHRSQTSLLNGPFHRSSSTSQRFVLQPSRATT
jgi:hypothetical protein